LKINDGFNDGFRLGVDGNPLIPHFRVAMKLVERTTKTGTLFYLQKTVTVDGVRGQKQIPLGDNKKTATTKANRFLVTLEESGYDAAMMELDGGSPLKKGNSPTLEQLETLYRDYLAQSPKPIRAKTVYDNLKALKRVMTACKAETISQINPQTVRRLMLSNNPTEAQQRGFSATLAHATSVFKPKALDYYSSKGFKISNPFEKVERHAPQIEAYTPVASKVLEAIEKDCVKELPPCESLLILLCLKFGLRRSEAEYCELKWFSENNGKVFLSVQSGEHFKLKTNHKRVFPVSKSVFDELLALRNSVETYDDYFISIRHDSHNERLSQRFKNIVKWLKGKGLDTPRPCQSLRAECGSRIASQFGIFEAQRVLGHSSPTTTAKHYANLSNLNAVGEPEKVEKVEPENPLQASADKLGISVAELLERIAKLG